ncbi:hypothetical protein MKW94_021739 [Papaver nudicaule]|uniref:DUF7722 domain-containing protein n=1 Tax=Papaver nudicaule TaxID=74823 RepID=A0AA41SED2_PAPNU|nr:hypothetical protein [Papaver nudicaule]
MRGGSGSVAQTTTETNSDLDPSIENYRNFQMPLNYPRYTKVDYEGMPEWKLDRLLSEYGLPVSGDVAQKRNYAMGAFLWPHWS